MPVVSQHVETQRIPGAELMSADVTDGLAAVPGQVLAASESIQQELPTADHGTDGATTWSDSGMFRISPTGDGWCTYTDEDSRFQR